MHTLIADSGAGPSQNEQQSPAAVIEVPGTVQPPSIGPVHDFDQGAPADDQQFADVQPEMDQQPAAGVFAFVFNQHGQPDEIQPGAADDEAAADDDAVPPPFPEEAGLIRLVIEPGKPKFMVMGVPQPEPLPSECMTDDVWWYHHA